MQARISLGLLLAAQLGAHAWPVEATPVSHEAVIDHENIKDRSNAERKLHGRFLHITGGC